MKFLTNHIAPLLITAIVKTLGFTLRFEHRNLENREKAKKSNPYGSYVLAVWHQNIVASILSQQGINHVAMVSASKDGDFAVKIAKFFGYIFVRGSSSRGGQAAQREMVKIIQERSIPGGITVDGPRGPNHEVKRGVVLTARDTQTPVLPLLVVPKNYWSFNSWDKFRLPKPFSKVTVVYLEPIHIPADLDKDDCKPYTDKIKQVLEEAEERLEGHV